MLYVIATPIGNLEDISLRALRILKEVDLILCEDTRVTKKLLARYEIGTPTISYHQHSRLSRVDYILDKLKNEKSLALVSDAGTPGISDPGGKLVQRVAEELPEVKIITIPGPCALAAAASISGLPTDKFVFMGFPPHKKGRNKFFHRVAEASETVIFYESPHRILKSLEELEEKLKSYKLLSTRASSVRGGQSKKLNIVVCRELTKKFETVYRGTVKEVIEQLKNDKTKGEFVVLVNNG